MTTGGGGGGRPGAAFALRREGEEGAGEATAARQGPVAPDDFGRGSDLAVGGPAGGGRGRGCDSAAFRPLPACAGEAAVPLLPPGRARAGDRTRGTVAGMVVASAPPPVAVDAAAGRGGVVAARRDIRVFFLPTLHRAPLALSLSLSLSLSLTLPSSVPRASLPL